MIRVLGIDLAAQPAKTGACLVLPISEGRWGARELGVSADDDQLVAAARLVDTVGVDAPLGWPRAFVAAVSAHNAMSAWPGLADRSSLTHRETDRRVKELTQVSALSVSADKLGIVAMRCALLQRRWADEVWVRPAPRDGSGPLVETYPGAALRSWGIGTTGYKGGSGDRAAFGRTTRAAIVREIASATDSWLDITAISDRCIASDHVLDALVSALVVIAAKSGKTDVPADPVAALIEGWIHVPSGPCSELFPVTR